MMSRVSDGTDERDRSGGIASGEEIALGGESDESLGGLPDDRDSLLDSTVSAGAGQNDVPVDPRDGDLVERPAPVSPPPGKRSRRGPPSVPMRQRLSHVAPARTLMVKLPLGGIGAAAPTLPAEEVRERLGRTAIQVAILFLVVYGVYVITYTPDYLAEVRTDLDVPRPGRWPVEHLSAVGTIVTAVAVFLLARLRRLPARLAGDVGLVFYVAVALGISVFEHWEPWPTYYVPIHISWVCLWIALYPLMVPARRGKLALAALAAALTGPMALFASVAVRGTPLPAVESLTWVVLPPFLAAALAVYPGTSIHRRKVAKERARELGAYQLTRLLSRGGMGEVWKAEHRLLARPAAIKLIRPAKFQKAPPIKRRHTVQRFEREARITASLRSPHTVELYDFGVTDDGSFYNVMELLDGQDLKTLVQEHGPLPPERAAHFLVQACDSLAEAHARNLVHRDIKPANLFACRYGLEVDFLKVLDFGLVGTPVPAEGGDTRLTADGLAAGTPAYIAPELARGDPHYDHRVDIYGLGCVAYWLLTARTVFQAPNPMAMLLEQAQSEPESPSVHAPVPLPEALDGLVMDCLSKDPDRRPRDAAALRSRLDAVPLEQQWTSHRSMQWWAEHHVELAPESPR